MRNERDWQVGTGRAAGWMREAARAQVASVRSGVRARQIIVCCGMCFTVAGGRGVSVCVPGRPVPTATR